MKFKFEKVIPNDKVKEPLEVGVWYNRDEFDENPNGYVLVEEDEDGDLTIWADKEDTKVLMPYTKRFMYLKLPEEI